MPLLETTVAAVGRLALAAAFDGFPITDARAMTKAGVAPQNRTDGEVLKVGPSLSEVAVYALAASAWLSERRTLNRHKLDHDAKAAVTFKDFLVTGAVITGVADLAVKELARRKYRNGLQVAERGEPCRDAAVEAASYMRYFRIARTVNRAFVAGAVAATPFINFGLFNAYKPYPIRSFFKL